ncbi:hypothetical protein OIU84_030087 [Salix udensis]|uniref:Uncharacterized protein n=1 Tax=Salix udensis TaxID=889485 RepID=A0AAD6KAQ6_9ROSI|nr:hypothetical protein OIU84_030087 [Salix udensis]
MAHGKARDMRDLASEKADQMAANIKASDSRETLAGPMEYGRGKIEGACDEVNQKWNIVKDKVLDGANNIEDTMGGALGYGKEQCNMEETELRMLMMRRRSMRKRTKLWLQRIQSPRRLARRRKQPAAGAMGYGGDGERDAFDETKHKVEEAYVSAKDTMTDQA